MAYVRITKEEMAEKLKAERGWIETFSGNEIVYDFNLRHKPIVVKVATSIRLDTNKARNKGADAIRVFAVQKSSMATRNYEVVQGLVKAVRVYRVKGWRDNLEKAVYTVIRRADVVFDKCSKRR